MAFGIMVRGWLAGGPVGRGLDIAGDLTAVRVSRTSALLWTFRILVFFAFLRLLDLSPNSDLPRNRVLRHAVFLWTTHEIRHLISAAIFAQTPNPGYARSRSACDIFYLSLICR
jgi:hypothetical protein